MNKLANKLLKEYSYQTGKYAVPPEFLSLIVTMTCNFRCRSCSIWQKDHSNELDEAGWVKLVDRLSEELKPNTFVEINGGEPLTKPALVLGLIKELKKHFHKVALNSNGLLINEAILDQLKQAGLDLIKISFYSLNPDTHNSLRGHPLAFEHAKRAIELINKKQIGLEVGILLTAQNIKDAPDLISYLQKQPNTSIILQPLDEKVESIESKDLSKNQVQAELWPARADIDVFFKWVLQNHGHIKNSRPNLKAIWKYYQEPSSTLRFRCFAGQRNLVVYPNGDLAMCFKGGVIGNLGHSGLHEVLMNARSERRKIKDCRKYCRIVGCNFSRGFKEVVRDRLMINK